MSGDNWLAIGDAAATFDPLSSNGVINAIDDAINVSNMIKKHLEKEENLFDSYNSNVVKKFNNYLHKRSFYYSKEKGGGILSFGNVIKSLLIDYKRVTNC